MGPVLGVLILVTMLGGGAAAAGQPSQQNEFVPMSEVPPEEQLPAPLMLAAAYGFAWVVVFGYVWIVARRVGRVEADLAFLERERDVTPAAREIR